MLKVLLLLPTVVVGQVNNPILPVPTTPSIYIPNATKEFKNIDEQRQQRQYALIDNEVQQNEKIRAETLKKINQDIAELNTVSYSLPYSKNTGVKYYKDVYNKMLMLNIDNYSVKDLTFDIENAYFENQEQKDQFETIIKNTGEFLTAKMKELKYDLNSNTAKNLILFQFFSETLNLKSKNQKHLPFKYDFVDYMGIQDYSKMFVTKLLATGSGQCHSMPLLYLILAEEINAEAFLSFSPNHSYIKFRDEKNKWYNIELTNGMFTASSFILNSGFIKAEAIQNQIYMQNLGKQELLSQFYVDLASGYVHKFGYDEFTKQIIDKALELYPKNINAQMMKATYNNRLFEYVTKQLGINPFDKQDLQRIKNYPKALAVLTETNMQYQLIDDLGYELMPNEAYENWLKSLQNQKNKEDNETLNKQIKGLMIKRPKN